MPLSMTVKGRYREPYNARHSFVSWNLMLGKNLLWVAKQHGHSVQTRLDTYAAWIDGSQAGGHRGDSPGYGVEAGTATAAQVRAGARFRSPGTLPGTVVWHWNYATTA